VRGVRVRNKGQATKNNTPSLPPSPPSSKPTSINDIRRANPIRPLRLQELLIPLQVRIHIPIICLPARFSTPLPPSLPPSLPPFLRTYLD